MRATNSMAEGFASAVAALFLSSSTIAAHGTIVTTTVFVNRHFEIRDHDQPTKYVFNGETRVAEVTGSLSSNARVQRLRVYPGWNLCSLAVTGPFPASGTDALSAGYKWNAGTGAYTPLSFGQTLSAGTILWLKAKTNAVISIVGTYTDPTARQVQAGGNYVPGVGLEAWTPVLSGSAASWEFDAATAHWLNHLPANLGLPSDPPPVLSPGEAFYLSAAAADSLAIPDPNRRFRYYHQDHLGSSSVLADAAGALLAESTFHPFGARHQHSETPLFEEAYQFTQKERDGESGLQYFEARYLSDALSRFGGVDSKYAVPDTLSDEELGAFFAHPQFLNLYAYVVDNPVRWTDRTGLAPGDPYRKPEEAATDALIVANPKSIADNREYGGLVYYDPALKRYYATPPVTGTGDTFNPSRVSVPKGTIKIGDYHTHGDYTFMMQLPIVKIDATGNPVPDSLNIPFHGSKANDFYDSDHFSNTDLNGIASDATGVPGYKGYLGTPSGNFQQYDPTSGTVSGLSTAEPAEAPIDCRGRYTGSSPYFQITCE